jgi:cell pole-organizing protein PopZ
MSEAKANQEPSMEEILASIRRIISEDGPEPSVADIGDVIPSETPKPVNAAPANAAPAAAAKPAAAKPAPAISPVEKPAAPKPAPAPAPSPVSVSLDDDDDDDEELVLTDVVTASADLDSNVVQLKKAEPESQPQLDADDFGKEDDFGNDDAFGSDVELDLDKPAFSEPPMPAALAPDLDAPKFNEPKFEEPKVSRPAAAAPRPQPAAAAPRPAEAKPAIDPSAIAAQLSAEVPDLVAPAVADAATASFAQLLQQQRPAPVEKPTGDGLLVETLVRQAVEPMLKSWLDTHLEAIVERMVRREVERLARKAELS